MFFKFHTPSLTLRVTESFRPASSASSSCCVFEICHTTRPIGLGGVNGLPADRDDDRSRFGGCCDGSQRMERSWLL